MDLVLVLLEDRDILQQKKIYTKLLQGYLFLLVHIHWCIKSIYNGFAIVIDCTLKVVPFGFSSVQVMALFRISFWLLSRSDKNLACSNLSLIFYNLGQLRLIYIPHCHQALKLQCIICVCLWLEAVHK